MSDIPESAPHFSFDQSLGEAGRRISIDYSRLMRGLEYLDIPPEISSQTSVNLCEPNEYLGSALLDGWVTRFMFTLPGFKHDTVLRMGFRDHQKRYPYKIAAQAHPDVAPPAVRKSLLGDHEDVRPKDVKMLRAGDAISLIIAHEFIHLRAKANKEKIHEKEVKAQISKIVSMGNRSPWFGVIKVK